MTVSKRQLPFPALLVGILLSAFVTGYITYPVTPHAQNLTTQVLDAFDYEVITVSTTAVGFTKTKVSPTNQLSAKAASCSVETSAVRYMYHPGGTPTGTNGHSSASGSTIIVSGINNILNFKAIRDSGAGTDATMRCTYLR